MTLCVYPYVFRVTLSPQDLSYYTGEVKGSETSIHMVRLEEGTNTKGHVVLRLNRTCQGTCRPWFTRQECLLILKEHLGMQPH